MMAYTGGSAVKEYPFKASGVWKGKAFAIEVSLLKYMKARDFCQFGL